MRKQYSERDPIEQDRQGNYYCRHVSAMTAEGLHSKSDIAAELAHRDIEIDRLTKLLNERVELERASRPAGEAVAVVIDDRIGVELAWAKPPSAGRPPVGTKLYTAPPAVSVPLCVCCGKPADGETACELHTGQWTCSSDCWDKAARMYDESPAVSEDVRDVEAQSIIEATRFAFRSSGIKAVPNSNNPVEALHARIADYLAKFAHVQGEAVSR